MGGLLSDRIEECGRIRSTDNELPPADIFNVIGQSECSVVFYDKKHEDLFIENTQKLPGVKYFIGFDRTEDEGPFLSFGQISRKRGNPWIKRSMTI